MNVGFGLHSRKTTVKIVDHITKEIKSELFLKIIKKCVIIEEASTVSSNSVVVFLFCFCFVIVEDEDFAHQQFYWI